MTRRTYDRTPYIEVSGESSECLDGWPRIAARLAAEIAAGARVVCVECYPGAFVDEIAERLSGALRPALTIRSEELFHAPGELDRRLAPVLTSDPVFGRMNEIGIEDFFEPGRLAEAQRRLADETGPVLVVGTGAAIVAREFDVLVYANLARWEIQLRQRAGKAGNLGAANPDAHAGAKYKRAFFVDWRAADRLKRRLYDRMSFLLDTNDSACPKMISGERFREGLARAVRRPFRVVPFFDPGPWGGSWMRDTFGLPPDRPNYAWCFDCVPEENSLLLGFGSQRVEISAADVVFRHPVELLGRDVFSRFGAEFPIRFDLLDTMGGGNLSLQVHPLTDYIQRTFGMEYTQDESYYMLAAADDCSVYLGLKDDIDRDRMAADLRSAQDNGCPFPAENYVNRWPSRKHDHFLIPGGTIHCSGSNGVVLEISATPYIFTFKLWDWGRMGLDGRPRPVHLDHGLANIQWNRTTEWVRQQLINRVTPAAAGPGWREERTGLHELEFLETRRHWFTGPVPHETGGTVNVLNLVEGGAAVVESPESAFEPFAVSFAETFIVPAAVGPYIIRPLGETSHELATLKAFVRRQSGEV